MHDWYCYHGIMCKNVFSNTPGVDKHDKKRDRRQQKTHDQRGRSVNILLLQIKHITIKLEGFIYGYLQ